MKNLPLPIIIRLASSVIIGLDPINQVNYLNVILSGAKSAYGGSTEGGNLKIKDPSLATLPRGRQRKRSQRDQTRFTQDNG